MYEYGSWSLDDDTDEYLPHHRADQMKRLEGHGSKPTADGVPWPQREWWEDRDRIVLLHEYLLSNPADGSFGWELAVGLHAANLWSDGRTGTCEDGKMSWADFGLLPAPGWRMLTALPSCPNHHLRFPMQSAMLDRVREENQ